METTTESRATWLVRMWIDNEYGMYQYFREESERVWEETADRYSGSKGTPEDRSFDARIMLEEVLTSYFEEFMPELDGMWSDLLGLAIQQVDWLEVADTRLEECEGYVSR